MDVLCYRCAHPHPPHQCPFPSFCGAAVKLRYDGTSCQSATKSSQQTPQNLATWAGAATPASTPSSSLWRPMIATCCAPPCSRTNHKLSARCGTPPPQYPRLASLTTSQPLLSFHHHALLCRDALATRPCLSAGLPELGDRSCDNRRSPHRRGSTWHIQVRPADHPSEAAGSGKVPECRLQRQRGGRAPHAGRVQLPDVPTPWACERSATMS